MLQYCWARSTVTGVSVEQIETDHVTWLYLVCMCLWGVYGTCSYGYYYFYEIFSLIMCLMHSNQTQGINPRYITNCKPFHGTFSTLSSVGVDGVSKGKHDRAGHAKRRLPNHCSEWQRNFKRACCFVYVVRRVMTTFCGFYFVLHCIIHMTHQLTFLLRLLRKTPLGLGASCNSSTRKSTGMSLAIGGLYFHVP